MAQKPSTMQLPRTFSPWASRLLQRYTALNKLHAHLLATATLGPNGRPWWLVSSGKRKRRSVHLHATSHATPGSTPHQAIQMDITIRQSPTRGGRTRLNPSFQIKIVMSTWEQSRWTLQSGSHLPEEVGHG